MYVSAEVYGMPQARGSDIPIPNGVDPRLSEAEGRARIFFGHKKKDGQLLSCPPDNEQFYIMLRIVG